MAQQAALVRIALPLHAPAVRGHHRDRDRYGQSQAAAFGRGCNQRALERLRDGRGGANALAKDDALAKRDARLGARRLQGER